MMCSGVMWMRVFMRGGSEGSCEAVLSAVESTDEVPFVT